MPLSKHKLAMLGAQYGNNVISIFKMAAISHVLLAFGVMADRRRSAFHSINLVL